MKSFIALLVYALVFSSSLLAANCQSLGNGNWNTPATWSCGATPAGGDNITIQVGDTVRISSVTNITGAPVTITIDGVFLFDNPSAKLRLPCGSVIIITSTGSIQSEGVGQASHSIRICNSDVWTGSDGTLIGPLIIGIGLPIELTYFNTESNENRVDFTWQTASEQNNDFFTIEGSNDGINWFEMHSVDGAGTTQKVQNYRLSLINDDQFEYFRLKQTDFNGQFTYSDIVAVPLVRDELLIYPNPSNGNEVTINLASKGEGTLQLIRSDGRVVFTTDLNNQNVLHIENLSLEPGAYLLNIQQVSGVQTERLVVR